jgi:hypothetical protein
LSGPLREHTPSRGRSGVSSSLDGAGVAPPERGLLPATVEVGVRPLEGRGRAAAQACVHEEREQGAYRLPSAARSSSATWTGVRCGASLAVTLGRRMADAGLIAGAVADGRVQHRPQDRVRRPDRGLGQALRWSSTTQPSTCDGRDPVQRQPPDRAVEDVEARNACVQTLVVFSRSEPVAGARCGLASTAESFIARSARDAVLRHGSVDLTSAPVLLGSVESALDPVGIAIEVAGPVLYALLATVAGVTIVGAGGGPTNPWRATGRAC